MVNEGVLYTPELSLANPAQHSLPHISFQTAHTHYSLPVLSAAGMASAEPEDEVTRRRQINRDAAARSRKRQKDMVDGLKKVSSIVQWHFNDFTFHGIKIHDACTHSYTLLFSNETLCVSLQKVLDLESTKTKLEYDNNQQAKKLQNFSKLCCEHAMKCPDFREKVLAMAPQDPKPPTPPPPTIDEAEILTEDGQVQKVQVYVVNGDPAVENLQENVGREVRFSKETPIVVEPQHYQASAHQATHNHQGIMGKSPPASVSGSFLSGPLGEANHTLVSPFVSPSSKRTPKRVAQSQEHAEVCAKAAKPEPSPPTNNVRHFAKARKAHHGVSPLVEPNTSIQVHSTNGHQTTQHATEPKPDEQADQQLGYHAQTAEPDLIHEHQQELVQPAQQHVDGGEGGQQVVPPGPGELPAMLQDFDEEANVISDPNSSRKITRDGNKSYQTL